MYYCFQWEIRFVQKASTRGVYVYVDVSCPKMTDRAWPGARAGGGVGGC